MSKETGGSAFPTPHYTNANGETQWGADGMSLRQYAAIKLKVADSGVDWLDEMIIKSKRDDIAAKAMQARMTAFCGLETFHNWSNAEIAADAYELADAMLKAREA